MAVVTRNMLPVVEPRRRPIHRESAPGRQPVDAPSYDAAPGRSRSSPLGDRCAAPDARTVARARWAAPAFGREVDLVRLHLAPIRSRPGLAASFGREAFHADVDRVAPTPDAGPVDGRLRDPLARARRRGRARAVLATCAGCDAPREPRR